MNGVVCWWRMALSLTVGFAVLGWIGWCWYCCTKRLNIFFCRQQNMLGWFVVLWRFSSKLLNSSGADEKGKCNQMIVSLLAVGCSGGFGNRTWCRGGFTTIDRNRIKRLFTLQSNVKVFVLGYLQHYSYYYYYYYCPCYCVSSSSTSPPPRIIRTIIYPPHVVVKIVSSWCTQHIVYPSLQVHNNV